MEDNIKEGNKIVCISKDLFKEGFTYGKTYEIGYYKKVTSHQWINILSDYKRFIFFYLDKSQTFGIDENDELIYNEHFIGLEQWRELELKKLINGSD